MRGTEELRVIRAQGGPHALGHALGVAGRAAVREVLVQSALWQAVTAPAHAARVARLASATQARFAQVWAEIEGLAEGLGLPLAQVFAWNCRGDLLTHAAEGCTSVQLPGVVPVIGHNEDGMPALRGHAFLAHLQPEAGPEIVSFCYPGSIVGHTFACTGAGLVQAVNNLRLTGLAPAIPRMVLGRAVLACADLDAACDVVRRDNASGGFHMTLAQSGDPRLLSVEYGGGACAVLEVTAPAVHANHALHLGLEQVVTPSSRDRQRRGAAMLGQNVRAILRDTGGSGLPIFRTHPDDPDEENTLATAIFQLSGEGVHLKVIDPSGAEVVVDMDCREGPGQVIWR
ncbi:MAG: 6-aminopenicillanic acid acyl-transferase [Rhodobacteraceae bacterium]|nr:MAG: 6-aminopenicillanic acid acyl-transferase [Paracoccaceae bacterium]